MDYRQSLRSPEALHTLQWILPGLRQIPLMSPAYPSVAHLLCLCQMMRLCAAVEGRRNMHILLCGHTWPSEVQLEMGYMPGKSIAWPLQNQLLAS